MLDSEMEEGTTNEKAHQAMDGRSYESMEGRGTVTGK